jgi:hypothetical protein
MLRLDDDTSLHLLNWVEKQFPTHPETGNTLGMMLGFLQNLSCSEELAYWLDKGWWEVYYAAETNHYRK